MDFYAQQFGSRYDNFPRQGNEVNSSSIDERLNALTSLVDKFLVNQVSKAEVYRNSLVDRYVADYYPSWHGNEQQVMAMSGFPGQTHDDLDPYSNCYNPRWWDQPNFCCENQEWQSGFLQQSYPFSPPPSVHPTTSSGKSLEGLIKSLAESIQQDRQTQLQERQETNASFKSLENQISQLVVSVSKLEANQVVQKKRHVDCSEEEVVRNEGSPRNEGGEIIKLNEKIVILPPFPGRFAHQKIEEDEKEIFETFCKVKINIPVMDTIKEVPRHTEELCAKKRKLELVPMKSATDKDVHFQSSEEVHENIMTFFSTSEVPSRFDFLSFPLPISTEKILPPMPVIIGNNLTEL